MNKPVENFYHMGLAPDMLEVLEKLKFTVPTPIQVKAIPLAIEGNDVMGIAQTGTGKTLAFGIPMVQRLAATGGRGLVVVPTRELAMQVDMALRSILGPFKMTSEVLIGGVPIRPQITELRKNPDLLVATPGRLMDHIYQGTLDLGDIKVFVLDEADRMFDMGFAPDIDKIISCIPRERQTLFFSATMPPGIVKLAVKHMNLPIHVEIAPQGTTTEGVTQELFIVSEDVKKKLLGLLLKQYRGVILVFTRTKTKATRVTRMIREMNVKVAEIHSNRTMEQRMQAIEGFKRGRYRVLVATDVAARGIDVSMIELVVNYDLPDDSENYVHRIGRTGRAGNEGHAITFATPQQSADIKKIEKLIQKSIPRSKHPDLPAGSMASASDRPASQGASGQSRPRRRHRSR